MPTAARTSRAIPTKLRFGSRYPAKESAEVNTTSAATTRSKTPATRAACFSARTSSPPERKPQRTTIADISSTTLSPPKARRAGLCALQAAPSAITVSATIQTMERTSNRRMRRRTSDDTAWSAIFSFDCASDCFLILHPYRIGRGLLTCFAISIHSAQSRTQPLSPQERKSRDTLQLPGATPKWASAPGRPRGRVPGRPARQQCRPAAVRFLCAKVERPRQRDWSHRLHGVGAGQQKRTLRHAGCHRSFFLSHSPRGSAPGTVVHTQDIRRYYGEFGPWTGMAPDGSPLLVRDISSEEVYALDLQLP